MKIAISVPDPVFEAAEDLASRLGKSRSQLYAEAVAEYVGQRSSDGIRRKLDEVYGRQPAGVEKALAATQLRVLTDEAW